MVAVGVDIGGTKLLAVRLSENGTVEEEALEESPRTGSEMVGAILGVARRLAGGELSAIGVGVPGLVDAKGDLLFAPNLPGAAGTAVGSVLSREEPGAELWVGNDATAACWGEFRQGAGAGFQDLLMVTLGTGIGGGFVIGGKLVEGANRFAGEFGHMLVDPAGPPCGCGRRGCWERYASGGGLGAMGRDAARAGASPYLISRSGGDPQGVKGEDVTDGALDGDRSCLEILSRFAWWVAAGLANLANLFDPEAIVIGGGLIRAGETLLSPVRRAFLELVEAPAARPRIAIVPARLGPRAGAIGAALMARR